MNTNVEEKAINKLEKYNQQEIINLLNIFSDDEKEMLYNQVLNLNFEQIDNLYNELTKKEKVKTDNLEEIVAINKEKLSKDELNKYNSLGEKVIRNNQYALITMSGGQGTRLGFDKPKGEFLVDVNPTPKFLFQILAEKLEEVNKKYNVIVPWYIMTSKENDTEIKHFFAEHKNFEYPEEYVKFFKQDDLPLITENKKLILGKNKLIKEAANGNGGIFNAMYKNKILEDMKNKGVKWIFIGSIDNILLKIADTTLIGLAVDKKVEIATKSLLKNSPEEKVGAICKNNGKIKVIEYSEMSDEMKNKVNEDGEFTFGESHIMCNLFSLKALEILANKTLPYHIAYKKSEFLDNDGNIVKPSEPNAYKFETFIFDSWTYFNDIAILRGKREEDFAPIKNKDGVDSPKTAIELYNNYIKEK